MRSCRSIACLLTRGPRNSADSWQSRKWRSSLGNRVIFLLLYAVYGNVEDEGRTDGRTRSCVNSAVLHDGWESSASGGGGGDCVGGNRGAFAVLSLSAKSQSHSLHSLTHSTEGNVRPTPSADCERGREGGEEARPLLISLAHCERGG